MIYEQNIRDVHDLAVDAANFPGLKDHPNRYDAYLQSCADFAQLPEIAEHSKHQIDGWCDAAVKDALDAMGGV